MKRLLIIALLSLMLTNKIQSADADEPAPAFRTFLTRCLTCIYEQGLHNNVSAPCDELHITVCYPEEQNEQLTKEIFSSRQRVEELHARYKGNIGNRGGATVTISLKD